VGRTPGGAGRRRCGRRLGPPLARTRRQEALGAHRALVVDERDRSNVEPGLADEPEPRRTREQPAHVLVELGVHRRGRTRSRSRRARRRWRCFTRRSPTRSNRSASTGSRQLRPSSCTQGAGRGSQLRWTARTVRWSFPKRTLRRTRSECSLSRRPRAQWGRCRD
jgi:hypothetical protein